VRKGGPGVLLTPYFVNDAGPEYPDAGAPLDITVRIGWYQNSKSGGVITVSNQNLKVELRIMGGVRCRRQIKGPSLP